jgi:4-hydroxy-3-methylbut-2-enyl diphosphate reductase
VASEKTRKTIRADILGFCMGVRRAQEIAETAAKNFKGTRIYTIGPLVHNPKVLEDLNQIGIKTLNNLQDIDTKEISDCSFIIRAHGISPAIEENLQNRGAHIIDATCPKVKKSQIKAQELARKGYSIFLAGKANHAEIEGILGYAKDENSRPSFCVTVENASEAEKAAQELYKNASNARTALLSQTTNSQEEYRKIGDAIKKYYPNLEIVDTICAATSERQKSLRNLLEKAEAVIITGGKDSANTIRLYEIAQKSGKPCVLIENAAEIPPAFFNYKTIGLSAGASTPDSVINEIESRLNT